MSRTMVVNVAGLSLDLVNEIPSLAAMAGRGAALGLEPVLPAVTCTMQATLTTGQRPGRHGIIANGLYFHDTAEVRFWEQSARLVGAPRVWQLPGHSALRTRHLKVAMLFWQQSMYGAADVVLTPKPVHGPGGELIQDCYSRPAGLYARLAAGASSLEAGKPRGPFNLMHYWGPMAGLGSSRWIADASLAVWRDEKPDLMLTYLPHLDYSGRRAGPAADAHRAAARELEPLAAALLSAAEADGGRTLVLSEYSFLPVRRQVALNRVLREAGLLALREIAGAEYLYPGDSRAFALADNQVAHIYMPNSPNVEADARRVRALLAKTEGVAEVLGAEGKAARGLDHVRSGELVALAAPDAHFAYYWWLDDAKAPPFARTVDIHSKPGFDAAELLVDMATRSIPLSAAGIRGSHGLVLDGKGAMSAPGWGVYLDSHPPKELAARKFLQAAEAAHLLM
ncbi:MAG: alkaline phosphatase family protein [Planctomycetes bacterium]|nr:alkaline phosphatase family protein [Planctomycetota bacterium]